MNTARSFGDWLQQRRLAFHLTQGELARQVGCSTITLRKLEAEDRRPSDQMAERLAEVLQVAPADRPNFLRFARGDPFAAPVDKKLLSGAEQPQGRRHNLPHQLTSFIGREAEMAEVRQILASARLVTLTGVGGCGKTRLALEVASALLDASAYPNGVWLVELAPLTEPRLVPQAVANVLGVGEAQGRSLFDGLLDYLQPKRLLLVLDNCEHLIGPCAELAETLLHASPHLTVLATSREGLNIAGENSYQVRSLPVPSRNGSNSIETITETEAVRLFVERAKVAWPRFALTDDMAAAVGEICRQLDGIPLAIELAAARLQVLTVQQIAVRLAERGRFGMLTGGSRTAMPRHQTLAALIDWSYDLLVKPEQALLQRLAVFMRGWTLEAAEAVGAGENVDASEVLDLLTQLVNKSLVTIERESATAPRYHLLETIRQYGLAKLAGSGQTDATHRQHAAYYLALIETRVEVTSAPNLEPDRFERIGTEYDNLRAALAWTQSATGSAELALRLVDKLRPFWWRRGYFSEARLWFEGALALSDAHEYPQAQAVIFRELGLFEAQLGDYAAGQVHMERSLTLFRDQHDVRSGAYALRMLGWMARERGDAAIARVRLEESVRVVREIGDTELLADGLVTLGEVLVMLEDTAGATAVIEEGLVLWRERRDWDNMGWALNHLGHAAQVAGDYERARQLHAESQSLFLTVDVHYYALVWAYQGLGETALAQGDAAQAAAHLTEALALARDAGYRAGVAWCLAGLAGVAVLDEAPARAARLWGAAEALRQSIGARPAPAARATRERLMAAAREQLGAEAFEAAWAEGQRLTMEQAVALALERVE